MQAFTLTKRSFVNMSRDFGYYWLRLVIYIIVTVCIGTIYLNVGTGYNSILVIILNIFHIVNGYRTLQQNTQTNSYCVETG